MGKRSFWIVAALLLVSVVFIAQSDRPNVVLILADDLGYNDISLHGNTRVRTPNIDAIGKEGVWFTRGHTTADRPSLTAPAKFRSQGLTISHRACQSSVAELRTSNETS